MKKIALAGALVLAASAAWAVEPVKVPKSQVPPTFATDVARYASELSDWKAHMAKVEADKAAGVPKEKANAPFPPPDASPSVKAALDENGKPNFQIVDDGPSRDQVLAEKKKELITSVMIAADQASNRVWPAGKRKLASMKHMSIIKADGDRTNAILAKSNGIFSAFIGTKKTLDQATAEAQAQRTPEDAKFAADIEARRAKIEEIEKASAQMQSDIEDLTIDNVDQWKMTQLPY